MENGKKEICIYCYEKTATTFYLNPVSYKSYPCCPECLEKREKKQREIDERYLNIKPFDGPNEYGEYYDENSY